MKTKKIISIILTVLLMFSFCSFSVSAVENGEFAIADSVVHAYQTYSTVDSGGNTHVNTSAVDVTKVVNTSGPWAGTTQFVFPSASSDTKKIEILLSIAENFVITKGHEYNLNFSWAISNNLKTTCRVFLLFTDNDYNIIKTQELILQEKNKAATLYNIDLNFTPNVDFEQAYKCALRFEFEQTGTPGSQSILVSSNISLIDKDDETGLINSIIEAIKEIPEKIKGFFTDLSNSIKGFFDSLKNYILYFQDPVILNEDGVLVDENGNPIYVNPFDNSIEDIEETFNGWIEDIRSFISDMYESRVQVSGYLETGTGLINDVLSASPIISAVFIFIASFFVIRKVVGR